MLQNPEIENENPQGALINDVTLEGKVREQQKRELEVAFQATWRGRVQINVWKIGVTSFMEDPKTNMCEVTHCSKFKGK